MIAYRKRHNVLEKGEREWRVEDDALILRDAAGHETRKAWRDVTDIRLRQAPSRFKTWLHICELRFKDGTRWSIDNAHFAGFADFQDRSGTYGPFVRAVLARISAEAPHVRAYAGTTMAAYIAQIAVVAFAFAALAALFLTIPVFETSDPWWVTLKLVIIAAMLPPFVGWVRSNYPRKIALDAIPADAMPPAAASS
jgi:hypothetical protein